MAIIQETNVNLATHVRDVLNAAGGSVSNDITSFFKSAAKLNMWSKYKPVVVSVANGGNFVDGDLRWKGYDGKCGLTINTYGTPAQLRAALESGDALWSYTPPTGGTAQPRRLGDFRLYNTGAVNPVGSLASSYILRTTTTGYEFDLNMEVVVTSENNAYNLALTDIEVGGINLGDMYLGVYMVNSSGKFFFGTSDSTVGENSDLTITLSGDSGTAGEYMAYPFLASTPQVGEEQDGTFIGMNKVGQPVTIMAAGSLYQMVANASWMSSTEFAYDIELKNNDGSSRTFSNVRIILYRADTEEGSVTEGVAELVQSFLVEDSVTVSANSSTLLEGTQTRSRAAGYFYSVRVTTGTPQISGPYTPMDEAAPEA